MGLPKLYLEFKTLQKRGVTWLGVTTGQANRAGDLCKYYKGHPTPLLIVLALWVVTPHHVAPKLKFFFLKDSMVPTPFWKIFFEWALRYSGVSILLPKYHFMPKVLSSAEMLALYHIQISDILYHSDFFDALKGCNRTETRPGQNWKSTISISYVSIAIL